MAEPKTLWVLAGGGSLGAVQVGMLKALVDAGVACHGVVGASVGALNGAWFATRPDAAGIADLARIWCGLRREDVFPLSLSGVLRCWLSGTAAVSSPKGLHRLIRQELPLSDLERARLPLTVIATDLLDGSEVHLERGAAEPALLASTAIPGVFPPVCHERRWLVDGGIASNTPIAAAVAQHAERILVLPTGMSCALQTPPRGVIGAALHALNLLTLRQMLDDIRHFGSQCDIAVVPPLCPLEVSLFDFAHTAELIDRAADGTRAWLAAGGLKKHDLPPALHPHHH